MYQQKKSRSMYWKYRRRKRLNLKREFIVLIEIQFVDTTEMHYPLMLRLQTIKERKMPGLEWTINTNPVIQQWIRWPSIRAAPSNSAPSWMWHKLHAVDDCHKNKWLAKSPKVIPFFFLRSYQTSPCKSSHQSVWSDESVEFFNFLTVKFLRWKFNHWLLFDFWPRFNGATADVQSIYDAKLNSIFMAGGLTLAHRHKKIYSWCPFAGFVWQKRRNFMAKMCLNTIKVETHHDYYLLCTGSHFLYAFFLSFLLPWMCIQLDFVLLEYIV